jgi:hypothetical protein
MTGSARNSGFLGVKKNDFDCGPWIRNSCSSLALPLVRRSIALRIADGSGAGDDVFCAFTELNTLATQKEILNRRPMPQF